MRITVILAGTNKPSNCAILNESFIAGIKTIEPTTKITTIRLADLDLPHFTLQSYDKAHQHTPDVQYLHQSVLECDGLIIASPVWNFSVPAHLKNALDHLGSVCLDADTHSKGQLDDLPCAFLFTGGAPLIAWKALLNITTMHVSEALKYYGGAVTIRHFEPRCLPGRGQFGVVLDTRNDLLSRLSTKGQAFAKIVKLYTHDGQLPLFICLRRTLATWAYRIGNHIMYRVSNSQ